MFGRPHDAVSAKGMSSSVLIGDSCPVSIGVVVAVFVYQKYDDCSCMEQLSPEAKSCLSVHDRFRTIAIEQSMALSSDDSRSLVPSRSRSRVTAMNNKEESKPTDWSSTSKRAWHYKVK